MLYAHKNNIKNEKQLLKDHLEAVAKTMASSIENINFDKINYKDMEKYLHNTGLIHDIGKSMKAFQDYLETGDGGPEKNHSLISAAIFAINNCDYNNNFLYLCFKAIAMHHKDLSDKNFWDEQTSAEWTNLKIQYKNVRISLIKEGLLPEYVKQENLDLKKLGDYIKRAKYFINKQDSDMYFFMQQLIFSKLISADKLDSANVNSLLENKEISLNNVTKYIAKKNNGVFQNLDDDRNKIKNAVLNEIDLLSHDEIKNKRIFTLTAPTGTGKTLTSISAAIKLSERINKICNFLPSIITAMPFINILEQTIDDYEGVFYDVLVHYGSCEHDYKEQEEMPLKDRMLLTNAWEGKVIVTTFVQLFESIFTGKNKRLLKLHNMCNSIIILDEIQALREEYYPLIGILIEKMAKYYNTRFILMTATKPEILSSAKSLSKNSNIEAIELLKNNEEYFNKLKRTKIIPRFDVNTLEDIVHLIIMTKKDDESALLVINRVKESILAYELLAKEYGEENVLYLSTNLIGKHRKMVIEHAKMRLKNNISFILVSTQTVEAGVDLDFHVGYRDLAPLPSVIQMAGRVNRAGEKGCFSPVYIFDLKVNEKNSSYVSIYNAYAVKETKKCLCCEIEENKYRDLISDYYKIILDSRDFDKDVYDGVKRLNYTKIEEFKLIKEQERITVLVEWDDEIKKILEDFSKILDKIKSSKKDDIFELKANLKWIINKIGAYTVEVYMTRLQNNLPPKCSDFEINLDYYFIPHEELNRYYSDKTGFIDKNNDPFY